VNRAAALILAAVLALASASGVWYWQNSRVVSVQAEADAAADRLKAAEARLRAAEANLRRAEEDLKSSVAAQTELSRKVKRLEEALRVDTSERDVAIAYGKARITRNDDWILALMTAEVRAAFTPFPTTMNPRPSRYEISGQGDTWVVRVFEHSTGEGEIGYIDSSLTIRKLADGYFWIVGHRVGGFVSHRGASK
jgi:hypothetical protein